MCLIIYSPQGKAIDAAYWYSANQDNADGIGVMSRDGVRRFLGKGQAKQGYAYMLTLAAQSIPFGVHFRWRTHGARDISQVHPHKVGDNVYLMHNGVLSGYNSAKGADACESDTALFCRDVLAPVLANGTSLAAIAGLIEYAIGYGNKFLTYDAARDTFALFNEYAGTWNEDHTLWSSNDYSLPGYQGFGFPHRGLDDYVPRDSATVLTTYPVHVDPDLVAAANMRDAWDKKFCEDTLRQRLADKRPTLADFNYDESEYAAHLTVNERVPEDEAWEQAEYELDMATEPIAEPVEQRPGNWSSYLTDMCAHCGLCDEVQIQACCGQHAEYVTPSSVIAAEIDRDGALVAEKPALILPRINHDWE